MVVWGSGEASREFLYVEDAAEAIVLAAEKYDKPEPLNLGAGEEIRIRDLVGLIQELVGYQGEAEWDRAQPDGQPRRCLDTQRAWEELGWRASTPFRVGLKNTIDWYTSLEGSSGASETEEKSKVES
jgi:GDP-L-fucose synthase